MPEDTGPCRMDGHAAGSDALTCTLSQLPKHSHVQTIRTMDGKREIPRSFIEANHNFTFYCYSLWNIRGSLASRSLIVFFYGIMLLA